MPSPRCTKIVATLGPATESPAALRAILQAGCNVVRLNASHGTAAERQARYDLLRRMAAEMSRHVAVLLDLAGPKIRVAAMTSDPLPLSVGQEIVIARDAAPRGAAGFSTTYPRIVDDCRPGERLLLDDGAMELTVREARGGELRCQVKVGGTLLPRKGINLPETTVSVPALTPKDREDLAWALAAGVEFIGLSFVRRAADIVELRGLINAAASPARIIAKIEKPEAVANIAAIMAETDGIMVARGDLGVEMDVAEVPLIQKRLIRLAIEAGKPVITATQMLQSMIDAPTPTRAEVSDVANSILDGTDAVMLSGETAVGRYAVESVAMMDRVARLTERHEREFCDPDSARAARLICRTPAAAGQPLSSSLHSSARPSTASPPPSALPHLEKALADGAEDVARDIGAAAIVVLTHSGQTALAMSKLRTGLPIIGVSDQLETCRRMALYRGVTAVHHPEIIQAADLRARVSRLLGDGKLVEPGSPIVIISGQFPGQPGSSDMVQVCRV